MPSSRELNAHLPWEGGREGGKAREEWRGGGGEGVLGQFLLGMGRWPLRAPTPL